MGVKNLTSLPAGASHHGASLRQCRLPNSQAVAADVPRFLDPKTSRIHLNRMIKSAKLTRTLALRDAALAVVKRRGAWEKVQVAKRGPVLAI